MLQRGVCRTRAPQKEEIDLINTPFVGLEAVLSGQRTGEEGRSEIHLEDFICRDYLERTGPKSCVNTNTEY